jgi:hypothetical protein
VKHRTTPQFWELYDQLPKQIQQLADKNFALLKADAHHPSLRFKKVGNMWSARVGLNYRALATEHDDSMLWFWIGSHADYDRMMP